MGKLRPKSGEWFAVPQLVWNWVNIHPSVPTHPHLAISRPIFSPPTCCQLSNMPQINNHKPEVFISEITVVGLNRKIDAFISTHWEDKAGCRLVLVAGNCTQRLSLRREVRKGKSWGPRAGIHSAAAFGSQLPAYFPVQVWSMCIDCNNVEIIPGKTS